jgi:hypothetical protein
MFVTETRKMLLTEITKHSAIVMMIL